MKKFAVLSLIVLIAVFGFGQTYDGWHNRTFEVSGIADIDTAKINVLNENLDADQKMISDIGTLATDSVISNSGNLKLSGAGTGIVENTDSLQINVAIVPDANDGAFLGTDNLNFQEVNARQGDFDSTFVGILGENIDANQMNITDLNRVDVDTISGTPALMFGNDLLELQRSVEWYSKTQVTIKRNVILIGSTYFYNPSDVVKSVSAILDVGSISNGKDYCVYAVDSSSCLTYRTSLATTYPSGYDANSSRKLGGFHTLCVSVGTISEHTLTDYVANDILPASVWDLSHRPISEPAGMVYVEPIDAWVDIYLTSGTGASTLSVYGGTISDTRNWMDFVDDGAAVKKRLMRDAEFQIAAGGSNEGTNISTSADPVTTGGHSDTGSRRMISNYGIEDMCGVMWQWLDEQSYRFNGAVNHTHQITVSGDPETVTSGNPSVDVAPTFSYKDETGGKGKLNTQGTYGDIKLLAGGFWGGATDCGSRGRIAYYYRWSAGSGLGGRFVSEPKK